MLPTSAATLMQACFVIVGMGGAANSPHSANGPGSGGTWERRKSAAPAGAQATRRSSATTISQGTTTRWSSVRSSRPTASSLFTSP